jgi:hypothetical protein
MNDFHVWENYSFEQYAILRLFTTSATPTFLFLFGMMLELVYFPRLKRNGLEAIKPALFKRSFQCYLGFILISLAGLLGGFLTLKRGFATLFLAANNHYGNILKVYAVMIILAIPLLLIRKKYGLKAVLIISISYWLLYPLFSPINIVNGNIAIFMSSLFGIGNAGGPSVFNSLIIVGLGMLSASFIDRNRKYKFLFRNLILLSFLLISILLVINQVGIHDFIENYFDNTYRNQNHPSYYLLSMSLALFTILVFSVLTPIGMKLKSWAKILLVFGRNSLSAYTLANILLNLIFLHLAEYTFSTWTPIAFIMLMYLTIFSYEKFNNRKNIEKNTLPQ